MKDRNEILNKLLELEGNISDIKILLREFEYDSTFPFALMEKSHIISVLERYISGHLLKEDLIEWANLIEGRDDIGFFPPHGDVVQDAIQKIANPSLFGDVTRDSMRSLALNLKA